MCQPQAIWPLCARPKPFSRCVPAPNHLAAVFQPDPSDRGSCGHVFGVAWLWGCGLWQLSAEEMGMVAEQNSGIWALYMPICDVMYTISRSSWFGTTMLLIILLASVLVGMSAGGCAMHVPEACKAMDGWTDGLF